MVGQALTRGEVAHAIRAAFGRGGVDKMRLAEVAVFHHARPQVCEALRGLPDLTYHDLDDLWDHIDVVEEGG